MSATVKDLDRAGRLRIMVVHNRYRSRMASGENRVVEQEIDLLERAGHEVLPYLRSSDEIASFSPLRKLALPARVVWSREDARALARMAARTRPDIVHVHNTFPLISPSAFHALAEAGIASVMTVHNSRLFCANGLLFRDGHPCEDCVGSSPLPGLVHACYRGSHLATGPVTATIAVHRRIQTWDRVGLFVAPSEFLRGKLVNGGLPSERVVVKPNFVPTPESIRIGVGEHFLYLGRLSHEKGVDQLLEAWTPDMGTLLIAGDGPERPTLEALAGRSSPTVRFLGHRSSAECGELLRSARALVLPSRVYEVFPLAVVEAFAHGVPVIAPAHGPFPDVIDEGGSGLLFRPGDVADLSRCLWDLSDAERSRAMGAQARSAYEARYTEERCLSTLEAIYERAIASRHRGTVRSPVPRDRTTRSGRNA
jgi:glycosyltransferase involved in cell wall biosynthesis